MNHSAHIEDVSDVSVTEDCGMKMGLVNWPVTTPGRGSLTRLNLGGSAAVTFSKSGGHRYQFVLLNRQSAEVVAEAISDEPRFILAAWSNRLGDLATQAGERTRDHLQTRVVAGPVLRSGHKCDRQD